MGFLQRNILPALDLTMHKLPVLFIIFNRPDIARKVMEKIREYAPEQLFIVSDGPRLEKVGEFELVKKTRNTVERLIDWDVEVYKKYASHNLGCGYNVDGGISWFFQHVEMGVILEDDCVPAPSFFVFMERMLIKYSGFPEIMHVSGTRYDEEFVVDGSDYHFSKYGHIHGWGTWKRAWNDMDIQMSVFTEYKKQLQTHNYYGSASAKRFWLSKFQREFEKSVKTSWGYAWQLALHFNKGLAIIPRKNLVSNIGEDGTHSFSRQWHMFSQVDEHFVVTVEPEDVKINEDYDRYHFQHHFNRKSPFVKRVLGYVKRKFN